MKGESLIEVLVFMFVFVFGAMMGADMTESDNKRDCDKLGRVVLDGKAFECREVGK